jgi:hypothetical protein
MSSPGPDTPDSNASHSMFRENKGIDIYGASLYVIITGNRSFGLLQSGDISKSQLDEFDADVRGQVQSWIGGKGIPRPVFHMWWKDGGVSLPTVEGRLNTMVIGTVVQLLKTQDDGLRKIFRAFLDEERDNRHFAE